MGEWNRLWGFGWILKFWLNSVSHFRWFFIFTLLSINILWNRFNIYWFHFLNHSCQEHLEHDHSRCSFSLDISESMRTDFHHPGKILMSYQKNEGRVVSKIWGSFCKKEHALTYPTQNFLKAVFFLF